MSRPSLLAHRDFRLLLAGQTTSQFGTQISGVAVPLLAVLTLHASPFEVGLVSASSTLAFALIGLPAGAWLDRLRKRPVLVVADLARAALLASVPVAALLGLLSIPQLVVVSVLAGAARVFFDVGYQSYVPTVIGRDRVLAGNSAMELLRASGQVAGPGVGGVLVSLIGAAAVLLVDAITFLVSAVTLLAIRTREATPVPDAGRPRLLPQIRDGVAHVVRDPVLRALALCSALSNFAFALASAVTIVFANRTLGLPAAAIGLLLAAGSVTVMAGAALTPRLAARFGSARIIWLSLLVTGPLNLVGVLAQPGWLVLLLLLGIAAGELGQIVYAITSVSLRQQVCPEHLLSRVNATMRVAIMGLFPLGAILGGLLGDAIGPRLTLAVSGAVLLVAPLLVWRATRGVRDVQDLAPTA
jgi:MFS family permease